MNLFNSQRDSEASEGAQGGPKRSELSEYSKRTLATLGTGGNMRQAVQLPPGENVNEWSHTAQHSAAAIELLRPALQAQAAC